MNIRIAIAVAILAVACPVELLAHAMQVRVEVSATEVVVAVNFDGEDDIRGKVTVKLIDESGKVVATSEPDRSGRIAFPRPKPGKFTVVAEDDGFGHRAVKSIEIRDAETITEQVPPSTERPMLVIAGLAGIGVATLGLWWWFSRKRD